LSPKALGDVAGKDVSIWDIIAHYDENPVGARVMHDYEKATVDEFAMIAGTLSETQRVVWENNQKLALLLGDSYNDDLIQAITQAKRDGKTFIEAYNELKDEHDITLAKVKGTYDSV